MGTGVGKRRETHISHNPHHNHASSNVRVKGSSLTIWLQVLLSGIIVDICTLIKCIRYPTIVVERPPIDLPLALFINRDYHCSGGSEVAAIHSSFFVLCFKGIQTPSSRVVNVTCLRGISFRLITSPIR
jgi:hypothetical protein